MKKLLTGLLMFSQAAVKATTVDSCSDLFPAPTNYEKGEPPPPTVQETNMQQEVMQHYNTYCSAKASYNMAVSDRNSHRKNDGIGRQCLGNPRDIVTTDACVERQEALLSGACARLREDQGSWSNVWKRLSLKPC